MSESSPPNSWRPDRCCQGLRQCPTHRDEHDNNTLSVSRRGFIWGVAGSVLALQCVAATSWGLVEPLRRRRRKKILVPIFLRGGSDGLNMVVPYGDSAYYDLRSSIAIDKPGAGANAALDLDGYFGLHPALAPIHQLYRQGRVAVHHAVGHDRPSRSHFEEQDVWETGTADRARQTGGWLNRYLAEHRGDGVIRAVSFGAALPTSLRGQVPAQAITRLEDLSLDTHPKRRGKTLAALQQVYGRRPAGDGLGDSGKETLAAMHELGKLQPSSYKPAAGAEYRPTTFGNQLRQAAQLIKADLGVEVVEVELGGWDTHSNQGGASGSQATLMQDLATNVAAFLTDLGTLADDVVIMTMTEFGRTAAENGTGGTDHGNANSLLVIGSEQSSQGVQGEWPGLGKNQLNENRDLATTTDFRDIFADVLVNDLGCSDVEQVLPGWKRRKGGKGKAERF